MDLLVVDGERSSQGLAASGAFLETALAPTKSGADTTGSKTDSPFAVHVIGDQDLNEREVLSQYRAVMITNVARISEAVAQQLDSYVKQGGMIMWFMGPKVDGDAYNSVLLAGDRKLLPGKLLRRVSAGDFNKDAFLFDFKPDADLSTYLNVFKGEANTGLGSARVFQYWQLNVTDPTTERVLNYQAAGQTPAGTASRRKYSLTCGLRPRTAASIPTGTTAVVS